MVVGRLREIWRFPVKSMGGGTLERAAVGTNGIPGDRAWALRDEAAREIRGAKNFPRLLECSARYLAEPRAGESAPAEMRLPDGTTLRTDAPDASARLSKLLGREVTLWPLRPASDEEHYRRRLPKEPAAMEKALRDLFGRIEGEDLPDISGFPREVLEFASPRGTYFDAYPIHLVTTGWLDFLSTKNPGAAFDRRRFRPNFLIETEGPGRPEAEWLGREIRVGGVRLKVELPCPRCSMTLQPQEGLAKDPSVLRTIVRDSGHNVGVYASVVEPGEVRPGDPIEI